MEHGTLLNVMWQPGWEGSWGRMDTRICMAESLRCLPGTITTLFISYTIIQSKKFFKNQYIHEIEYYSGNKIEWNSGMLQWMNLEDIM